MQQAQERPVAEAQRVTLWQTAGSVLWSFFGVQSRRNWARDFTYGNAGTFILVGLALASAFVLSLLLVVKLILRGAGL